MYPPRRNPQPGTCNRPRQTFRPTRSAPGRVRVPGVPLAPSHRNSGPPAFASDSRSAFPPPHFHAIYGEFDAQVSIDTLEILRGHLPRRVHVLVIEWALAHRPELRENWRRAERHEALLQILPLDKEP